MYRATVTSLVFLVLTAAAAGQQVVSARAGLIYYAEGAVFFDSKPARLLEGTRYPTLANGQIVSTERGHVEILLGASAVLWVGPDSKIRMEETSLEDVRIRVEAGSAMIEVRSLPTDNRIRVMAGDGAVDLTRDGLYRFDTNPPRARVYDGELIAKGSKGTVQVRKGQEVRLPDGSTSSLDRTQPDEFHYWAAWRSYQLAGEGRFEESSWTIEGLYREARRNSGFDIEFPANPGAARMQYLTATAAGLVYYLKGGAILGGRDFPKQVRVPFHLPPENTLETQAGDSAELFLGVGVAARIDENSKVRLLVASPSDATLVLYKGKAMIEVSRSARDMRVRVGMGESITELLKAGLYEFDADALELRIYGGEAEAVSGDKRVKARERQMLTLAAQPKASRFDHKHRDALYQWSYQRSLVLARSNVLFMTQWERVGRLLHHPQFGNTENRPGR